MEKYIEGNKAAWEEAFENRDASWGTDITARVLTEDYGLWPGHHVQYSEGRVFL